MVQWTSTGLLLCWVVHTCEVMSLENVLLTLSLVNRTGNHNEKGQWQSPAPSPEYRLDFYIKECLHYIKTWSSRMFYSWLLESGYVGKDGLQSAVRGVYLQNKLPFQFCTGSDWVTVKNYLLVLKCQWIQLRNYFFYKTIMASKKKGKYGIN